MYVKGQQSSPAFLGSVEYTLSNEEVVELDNSNTIKFLKAGETDLTVASETGVSNTVHITVKEPKSLELDSPVPLASDCKAYSFVPSEDGAYGFSALHYSNSIELYHDNQYVSQCKNVLYDNGNVLQCELKAGEKYTVVFNNYLSNVQLNVSKLEKAQKLELHYQFASQPVTEINAEIGGEAIIVPSLSDGEYEIVITCGENTYTVTSADADSAYFQMLSDIEDGTVTAALNYGGKLYDVKLDIICGQTPEVESITVTKAPDAPICD